MNSPASAHSLRRARLRSAAALALLLALTAACGGPPPDPTPIPADVVRPQQPTPPLSTAAPAFRVDPATPEPAIFVTPMPTTALTPVVGGARRSAGLAMRQPPSAMGIATAGVTLLDAPGGAPLQTIPPGGTLTVTGRSQDGAWLAAFATDSTAGWIPAGSVVLYGADDLTVVDFTFSPAPVATLLADAMQPVASPMSDYLTRGPAQPPAATPAPGVAEGRAAGGQVISAGRLNVRAAPAAEAEISGRLEPESALVVLGRSADGQWLSVRQGEIAGWAAAQFVRVDADPAALPVLQ